jgi:hypothetical protein
MKHLFLFTIITWTLLASCSSSKPTIERQLQEPVVLQNATETESIRGYRIDTAFISLPAQKAEKTVQTDSSYLETDYAESTARINPDGTLYHDLKTKAEKKIPVAVPATSDTLKITKTVEKPVYYKITKTEKVERDFTWWEKTRLYTWWLFVIAIAARAAWKYRTKIKTAICNILSTDS